MEKGIKEIQIDNERLFVKKSKIFGWGFVNPIKIDGKVNWKNLLIGGSWIRFILLAVLILIIAGCVNEYISVINLANECINQPRLILLP